MTLEFQPPYQLQNPQVRQDRQAQQFDSNLLNVGNSIAGYRQQQKQDKMQQTLLALKQNEDRRAQTESDFNYGGPLDLIHPMAAGGTEGPSPSGSLQQGTTGPQPMSMPTPSNHDQPMTYADNIPTTYPHEASAGTPDTGWPQQTPQARQPGQPWHAPGTDLTAHFMAHRQQGGGPYDHLEMGGTGQGASRNPMDIYSQISKIPGAKRQIAMANIFKDVGEGYKAMYPDTTEPVISQDAALRAGTVKKGARIINTSTSGVENRAATLTDKQLADSQKAYNGDKNIEKAQAVADKISEAVPLLKAGVIDNATAKQALQTVMTYAATGGMRVNEVELRQFGGANAVTNKMAQWYQGLDKGTLTPRDAKDMTAVLDIFGKSAQKSLQEAGLRHTQQYLQRSRSGESEPEAYKRVTGRDFTQGDMGGGQGGGMIRVRNKQTGQTGQLPAGNFDASKYDQLQ